jgi:hypothetical protein
MMTAWWLNFVMYETGWLLCVIGAAFGVGGWGAAFAMFLVCVHVMLATERGVELRLVMAAAACGLVVDFLLIRAGVLRFFEPGVVEGFPPLWMTVLWMQFATTLRYCLSWLSGRYLLGGIFGLAGAPAAFLGGARLGAVAVCTPALPGLLYLGVLWSVVIPLLLWLSVRFGGGRCLAGYRWLVR